MTNINKRERINELFEAHGVLSSMLPLIAIADGAAIPNGSRLKVDSRFVYGLGREKITLLVPHTSAIQAKFLCIRWRKTL